MAELQTIPARHGVATFVPAGQTIKIINTSGTQVVDTWAFALPKPEEKGSSTEQEGKGEKKEEPKKEETKKDEAKKEEKPAAKQTPKKRKGDDLPSQEDAEKATSGVFKEGEHTHGGDATEASKTPQKSTWSSYVPTLGLTSSSKKAEAPKKAETEQQKNSRTWSSYFPSGQSFSSYVPKSTGTTVSKFAEGHQRDMSKSYLEQLQDFSKTPVGAAGMAAITGSGYSSSLYAGYQAWNSTNAADVPPMEFMSMPHSRAASLHLRPQINDVLVSNVREPMLTLVEDTSPGIHDTLMAACDPYRYKGLGVENWGQHGSCAENLVLALKELNERAGLKGAKGVGADVTINSVPAPLNLFMNIPWTDEGDLAFKAPKGKAEDYVRFKAERDVVVVMSACPQDVLEINAKKPADAHFVVEEDDTASALKRTQPAKKKAASAPKKLDAGSRTTSSATKEDNGGDEAKTAPAKKPAPVRRSAPVKKPTGTTPAGGDAAPAKKPAPKPAAAAKKATESASGDTNGTAAAPEKKKPRKLQVKPKAET
ncbi:hypothetical protein LTR62_000020 [Meristemomyces frigidus]|uniref:DUF1989 domain-containing protein n=1 Tax=Meristemomyces frigidus TaxID=1508187 RepID=A0AAN7YUK7_9PEZI|nr:hypothetical protein LTR62_000020 [Meristemomyces frigidus]